MHRSLFGALALVLLSGCLHVLGGDRVERHGWHRVYPADPEEEVRYEDRFERVAWNLDQAACETIAAGADDPDGPIVVLLHGAGGEGVEMKRAVPLLADSRPASLWVLRWSPWDRREALVAQLASGLSRLAECVPGAPGRLIVLGHSAGGVLAALAAGRVAPPGDAPEGWLTVVTIAAPLSGHLRGTDHGPEPAFMFDLANTPDYPYPARGVRVLHLRTTVPGDVQMVAIAGHAPNDIRVGVPGAPQIDLPEQLTHAGALVYVSHLVADGAFHAWLEPRQQEAVQEAAQQAHQPAKQAKGRSSLGGNGAPRAGRRGPRDASRPMSDLFHW